MALLKRAETPDRDGKSQGWSLAQLKQDRSDSKALRNLSPAKLAGRPL